MFLHFKCFQFPSINYHEFAKGRLKGLKAILTQFSFPPARLISLHMSFQMFTRSPATTSDHRFLFWQAYSIVDFKNNLVIISHDRKLLNTDQLIINLSLISHQLFGVSDYEDDRLSFPKCRPFLVWCILKPTNENKTKKNMRKACKNAASVFLCHCKSDTMQCSVLYSMQRGSCWDESLGPSCSKPD